MSSVLISATDISKAYSSGYSGATHKVLQSCSLTIHQGEVIGLMGPSGSGKSTFGRILAGLDKPDRGSIQFKGITLNHGRWTHDYPMRRKIQVLFQDPGGTFNPVKSIHDSFLQVLKLPGVTLPNGGFSSVLDAIGIHEEILARFPHEISGGQAQRLALARILLVNPELIILDEPTSALDLSVQAQILHLLKQVRDKRNISYLFISHDEEVLRFMCDTIFKMKSGTIVPYK